MEFTAAVRRQVADTIRMLSADAVEKANSGHPGAPMGQADLAVVLWEEFLGFDPSDPGWLGRDRFVLSCGHASMLLYSLLHLWGYELSMEDIRNFRQWDSLTPGHPEVGHTAGVETTTGPLGQGVANSVGMALASKLLGARVDVPGDGFQVFGQRVYALCSDGDLMEGVASEAASMAGHWRLDNLVWIYDDNAITIDGSTDLTFTEDVAKRFEAFGWNILRTDGHDHGAIRVALTASQQGEGPTLILARTRIGYGSPNKVDRSAAHGAPLGGEELAATRAQLSWPEASFHIPGEVAGYFEVARGQKAAARKAWNADFAAWRGRNPERAALLDELMDGGVPADLDAQLLAAIPAKAVATRKASAAVLRRAVELIGGLIGGSADLAGSNGINVKDLGMVGAPESCESAELSFAGRQIHFGIREHAMGAVTNGMLLHGGLKPYSGTFLVFSDYMRPAVRLAALCELPNIFVYTHDSIFLGEDGPTHQAVEHHWALRTIPGLTYFRPADSLEVAMAWSWALQAKGPTAFGLTRQTVPNLERPEDFVARDVWKGAYTLVDCADPEVILVGTGSELQLCVGAAQALGGKVRVVSMPSYDLFRAQDEAYQEALLPSDHPRVVSVEAGITEPWKAITGRRGLNIGIDRFGASAPSSVLAEKFGFTVAQVTERVREFIG